ncbi:tRNA(Ile)-lysidine synthase [Marinobacterium zhoushanense]|uniref:tRNA(Ile)-lysidine synthase n=1 Tax=Marinobacterium zhoushanense TaxID=1679163 RepID=A0ABQ1KRW7_9GAMM|nr:tRNA lysidine(34) synthetase TilS [Marinobacterium zhoushanense]GGC08012.1 tRNA(Ile)-lysidine synthase [Marinobacterium zhoushanense]
MADLPALLAGRLERLPQIRRWVIAFSGGVDSRVLLELCARLLPAERLLALHVDHQVQASSGQWAAQCGAICAGLGVPFQTLAVNPSSPSEADLRDARYAAFLSVLREGDCLLLAQHADDQAETLLLRLLRGAGVRGLAAMPRQRALGPALLLRPLLDQPRERLEQWARSQQLEWVEDPSNADEGYDRNWLRLNLLPQLRARWPRLHQRVTTTTAQLAEAYALLDEVAAADLAQFQRGAECLVLEGLGSLSEARTRNLLRYWVHRISGHWLSYDELRHLQLQVIAAGEDRTPELQLGNYWLRRYRQRLYLLPAPPDPQPPFDLVVEPRHWALAQGRLSFESGDAPGIAVGTHLSLVYRQGGERLRPLGRGGSVGLKQLLQEAGVPPWWRADWPLLCRDGEIVAVPGICLCEGAVSESGLTPQWQPLGLSDGGGFGRL